MEQNIIDKLKEKGLADKSIKLYMTILKNLNDKREVRNLKFLENPKKIFDKIKKYKITTQRNITIAIVSILKILDNDLYKKYYDTMIDLNKKIEDESKLNKKSDVQTENWMKWDDIVSKFNELKDTLKSPKNISEDEYNNYLDTIVLGLYVLLPPRRNKDYLLMKVSKDSKMDDSKYNYLDIKKKQFVFNNYKTKDSYGNQIIDVPNDLMNLIKKYLKYKKSGDGYLLVKFNGESLKSDNAITRILNKILEKKVSSSMLRHIYLSDKYKNVKDDMEDDQKKMAHSQQMQSDYIKK
jgi:integrase